MTKKKHLDRRLLVVSKRRQPTDEGLARLVAAMVLYRAELDRQELEQTSAEDTA